MENIIKYDWNGAKKGASVCVTRIPYYYANRTRFICDFYNERNGISARVQAITVN